MDTLAAFLDGPRARGAFLLRAVMDPPFSLLVQDQAPLTIVAVVHGRVWLVDGDDQHDLHPGDVAIVRGPAPYTMADDPATPHRVVIHPDQHCTTLDGEPLAEAMDLGVRTWGNSATGSTVMLIGTYTTDGEISQRLLGALPRVITMADGEWGSPLIGVLAVEVGREDPGQSAVLDRLLDLLLIAALRSWFSTIDPQPPSWYRAHADPVIGRAVRALHNDAARAWTVGDLASTVGVSRAALARRFTELVGQPPMTYLTEWRLALAADLLREPGASVSAVGRAVGYSSPFTFSTAFKRVHGVSPKAHRAELTTPHPGERTG